MHNVENTMSKTLLNPTKTLSKTTKITRTMNNQHNVESTKTLSKTTKTTKITRTMNNHCWKMLREKNKPREREWQWCLHHEWELEWMVVSTPREWKWEWHRERDTVSNNGFSAVRVGVRLTMEGSWGRDKWTTRSVKKIINRTIQHRFFSSKNRC